MLNKPIKELSFNDLKEYSKMYNKAVVINRKPKNKGSCSFTFLFGLNK